MPAPPESVASGYHNLSPALQSAINDLIHEAGRQDLPETSQVAAIKIGTYLLKAQLKPQSQFHLETATAAVKRGQPFRVGIEASANKTDVYIRLPGDEHADDAVA